MKWYNSGKTSFISKSPKFVGADQGKRSWENIFIDVDIELSATLDDWLKDEFKNYFRKWSATVFNAVIVQTDEDDVTFGYIEMQKVILPYIAKYVSTSDNGSRYRIFFFSEIKPSNFDPSTYDYEEEINKLVEKGTWDV
jgi:hypothetical protein